MNALASPALFNNPDAVFEGWYWALPSAQLKPGQAKGVRVCGRDLVIWRGGDGAARIADAYCPHMGAHLALGRVEGAGLRCFFHGWRFDGEGGCDDIPALGGQKRAQVRLKQHEARERFGMIWVWVGDEAPGFDVPVHALLEGQDIASARVAQWTRKCSPEVMMINAIDAHHFRTVHNMPGEVLKFETSSPARHAFRVFNRGAPPKTSWLWRAMAFLYRDQNLYYEIHYFYASVGCVSLGPRWARLHLMFATRKGEGGCAEGVTLALAAKRGGMFGALWERAILWLTALGGSYFAHGDTKVFDSIRFKLQTPVAADRTVTEFIRHAEGQRVALGWRESATADFRAAAE